jgi:DNA-binding NarL/FixJ family response regulator
LAARAGARLIPLAALAQFPRRNSPMTETQLLNSRELEALEHAARGNCVKVIAYRMKISDMTVTKYLKQCRRAYRVNSTLQLVVKYLGHPID